MESASLTVESQLAKNQPFRRQEKVKELYKVHQLDWFDVETRVKHICNAMLKPVAEMALNSKQELQREQA